MTIRPPAEIGMSLDEVDTPALVIDLDAFERNLRRLPERAGGKVRLRPHAKTHKCAVIALKQMELGAVGVCCQKVSEAEALVYGGVKDVLVTNEIVGKPKLRRLMALTGSARIATCADDASQIVALDEAAGEAGIALPVHVEVNMGGNRCGVEPGEPALDLARRVTDAPHLTFAGLQAYHGSAQHLRGWEERQKAIAGAVDKATRTRDLLARNGIECANITGAGTGTFEFESASGVYTELQCGSYIFMDADYGKNLDRDGQATRAFEPSLFVWATVMSRPAEERAIVDAGLKALSVDSGMPTLWDEPAAFYDRASDEHGKLTITSATNRLKLGDKVKLVPGHCDPTVNLYDWYVGVRGDRVEAIWPIVARGAVY
jgi:D-serine deaminase-like pyridoxal phosphate-dependent protein